MSKNLVIVESPAKAKTIEKFLGSDYTVKSCFGHIRDLDKGDDAIDIKDGYKPKYIISDDKKAIVAELKKLSKAAEMVWLASDEDREGEAISWHLSEVLGLNNNTSKRIVFHEITKPAILKAIENPRDIDKNLVDAQQARRILDRLVGFELSPILWRKVKPSLSAGRVQSVAVRLIVEREREINEFTSKSVYKITAEFEHLNKKFKAELPQKFNTKPEAIAFLESCKNANFTVEQIDVKPAYRKPSAPFTTSTLQQEASRKLGFSVGQTMLVAQKLYEAGHITYMRTDSLNLSELAITSAKKEIESQYGPNYSNPKRFATKSASAQEAHEAIRPTYFENHKIGDDDQQKRLYDLIWKRTIASQMSDAQLERTEVKININTNNHYFQVIGEVIKFDGFLKVYLEGTDNEDDDENTSILPPFKVADILKNLSITATQKFSRPAPRYTEASLVKALEELGIGRPSTYAPTISTIQKRGYVEKDNKEGVSRNFDLITLIKNDIQEHIKQEQTGVEKNKLFPTDIGMVVTDFLVKHFGNIINYDFTASVEKEFDEIANGQIQWYKMLDGFYKPFHITVDKTLEVAEKATGERELGIDPESGKTIIARIGRYGPMVQIGTTTDEEKPKFAQITKGFNIETITLENALTLFALPRLIGEFESKPMKAAIGRFGPFIQHDSKFYSLPKTDDPYTVDSDRAIELILLKRKNDSEKVIKVFEDGIQILNGRWGPYIAQEKENYKIPKDTIATNLTHDDCLKLIESQKQNPKPKSTFRGKKK